MKIGVPKEVKNNEFRVGLTPQSVIELIKIITKFSFKKMLELK